MSLLDEVSKISIQLILKEPFYGHFFTGLVKEISEDVKTAAVGINGLNGLKLMINKNYWYTLENEEKKYGLIKHELLHLILKHITLSKSFEHKFLFNIAADLVVNQYISPQQLPEGGFTLEKLWQLEETYAFKLERNRDVYYYYKALKKLMDDVTSTRSLGNENSSNSEESELENEIEEDFNGRPIPTKLGDLSNPYHAELQKHQFWEEASKLSDAETKVIDSNINEILKQTSERLKAKGFDLEKQLPEGLTDYMNALFQTFEPVVNWRRIIRMFTSSSANTVLQNTLRRPSKRYGTTPGIKIKRKHKLLIAIDTSGSILKKDLEAFFMEIYHIWRQGGELYIVECDNEIRKHYPYRGKIPELLNGKGGTSFYAPIEFANEVYKPDAIIYFTDGFADAPKIFPRKPILWLITSDGIIENDAYWRQLPGRIIRMRD